MFHAAFGPGTGPIYMDNLACLGTEPVLTNCTHDTHTADCGHNEDASMRCNGTRKLPLIRNYGHIRVYISTYNHIRESVNSLCRDGADTQYMQAVSLKQSV